MKYEWRKQEKLLYLPKSVPTLVKVSQFRFLCLKGCGNPNDEDFTMRVQCLYNLSYAIRKILKTEFQYEYTVYPLEGLWTMTEKGKKEATLNKNELIYTLMIRQPDLVDQCIFLQALELTKAKKSNPLLSETYMEDIEDGLSLQILHQGSYDQEPESFQKMILFMQENHLTQKSDTHREIYLSDPRKSNPDHLKTVLRYLITDKTD